MICLWRQYPLQDSNLVNALFSWLSKTESLQRTTDGYRIWHTLNHAPEDVRFSRASKLRAVLGCIFFFKRFVYLFCLVMYNLSALFSLHVLASPLWEYIAPKHFLNQPKAIDLLCLLIIIIIIIMLMTSSMSFVMALHISVNLSPLAVSPIKTLQRHMQWVSPRNHILFYFAMFVVL